MIDGIKLECRISDFKAWKQATKINLFTYVEKDTGEVKERIRCFNGVMSYRTITYMGQFETYGGKQTITKK